MLNTVTVGDRRFTRKGKRMPYAVVLEWPDRVSIQWASNLDLAERNRASHAGRLERVLRGESLSYPWSNESYRMMTDIRVVPTDEH